ncbi:MAG: trehalase-like domain-containing protein [Bacteroidota bacterium]
MERHTYNMGLTGNCAFMAYIDTRGAVKWMCMPRFDSSFIFGSLIAGEKGGEFSIRPSRCILKTPICCKPISKALPALSA